MKTVLVLACLGLFACENNSFTKHSALISQDYIGQSHDVDIAIVCHHSTEDSCNAYLKLHCVSPTILSTDVDSDGEITIKANCLK